MDYCQDNAPEELIEIIYEEDDDYDYLTYQITGKTSLEEYIAQEHDCESVLLILRNVAQEMISLKEQAIPLSYVLLNRGFIYVDAEKKTVQFLCLPIERIQELCTPAACEHEIRCGRGSELCW